MACVAVQIVRFISDDQPGFVAAELRDAFGNVHTFDDKVPVFSCEWLDRDSSYPRPGVLDCVLTERWTADDGRELARIDTERPWDVASTLGENRFVVLAEQVEIDRVTDADLEALKGRIPHLKGHVIRSLMLGYTQITDAGLEHVRGLTQLEWLDRNRSHPGDVFSTN